MIFLRSSRLAFGHRPSKLFPTLKTFSQFHTTAIKMSTSQNTSRPAILSELAPVFTSLHDAKVQKQLSFEDISKKINRSEWYTAAIFYGQAKPEEKDLKALSEALEVPFEELNAAMGSHFYPTRGLGQFPPQGKS